MSVAITFEVPEDIAAQLQAGGEDLSRAALEAIALEGYRAGRLSHAQLMRLLEFESRDATDAFLKRHEVYDYTEDDLNRDRATLERLSRNDCYRRHLSD